MTSKVFEFMEKYHMIESGDLVVIGVSGGADSLCLFYLLLEYRKKVSFFPVVVHVNHGLRQEAAQEAEYVKKLCEEENVSFYLKETDCRQVATQKKISLEEAGRLIRYQAYEEAAGLYGKEHPGNRKTAVAHHGGDQAETMLFHLFRGTGIYGMAGILPVRGSVIRPLLVWQREEIEAYLSQRGIEWCNDASNQEENYTRNKIRHKILGYARKEINEKAVCHVARAAMQMVSMREYLEKEVEKAKTACSSRKQGQTVLSLVEFSAYPDLIREQVLLSLMEEYLPGKKDVTHIHIREIRKLTEKEGNKELHLPGGVRIKRVYDSLILEKKEESLPKREEILLKEGSFLVDEENILEIKVIKREDFFSIEENQYTKYLDYGKINSPLSLRSRQTGDYIVINDRGQKKRIKEYMIEEKIPKEKREQIPVVAEGAHILWIIGYRISAYYKISDKTEKILQMKMKRRE